MAPPEIGSEVPIRRNGVITSYNNDNTVNVKFDKKPGRPFKVNFKDVNPPALPPLKPLEALQPLDPLPSPPQEERNEKGGLFWTVVLTLIGGIAVGVSHALGHRILDAVWPYIQQWSPYAL